MTYAPGTGIERMRVGTPPVLQMAALDAAMDVWDTVDMQDVRGDGALRGSQVSFSHPEGYAIVQALIAQGVVGDFRAPNIIRFGITPLYLTQSDITRAADILCDIMANRTWDQPQFKVKSAIT